LWSDKEVFYFVEDKAICPKDAGLSLLSWGGKKEIKFGRSQATYILSNLFGSMS